MSFQPQFSGKIVKWQNIVLAIHVSFLSYSFLLDKLPTSLFLWWFPSSDLIKNDTLVNIK
jgi:hypothetical protein